VLFLPLNNGHQQIPHILYPCHEPKKNFGKKLFGIRYDSILYGIVVMTRCIVTGGAKMTFAQVALAFALIE